MVPPAVPPPPLTAAGCVDRGSLTRRIQDRCPALSVKVVFQGMRRVDRDERLLFAPRGRGMALVRDVYLYCGRTPVVFAHSVIDPRDMRGTWRRLAKLGSRPLGAALFADPRIRRYPLRQKKLTATMNCTGARARDCRRCRRRCGRGVRYSPCINRLYW